MPAALTDAPHVDLAELLLVAHYIFFKCSEKAFCVLWSHEYAAFDFGFLCAGGEDEEINDEFAG